MSNPKHGFPASSFPLINAVLDGSQDGHVFSIRNSDDALILHKAGFSSVILGNEKNATNTFVDFIVEEENVPRYFHIYDAPSRLFEACVNRNDQLNIRTRDRIQLRNFGKQLSSPANMNAEFHIKRIEQADIPELEVFGLSLSNKFWRSSEDFLQNSFGFIAITNNNEPASICYAACVSKGLAEIDVATLPAFQNKGLAKMVVTEFVQECYQHGITPNWDCFEENKGSLKTALAVGFEEVYKYSLLSIFNKTKQS